MMETPGAGNTGTGAEKAPEPRGVIFTVTGIAALLVIPAAAIAAIIIMVLLQPSFYTGILKEGRFITAFVQGKNWQAEKQINEEIERDLKLSEFTAEFEKTKARYDEAKAGYARVSRDDEIESLKKQRGDLRSLKWKEVKETFPDRTAFEKNRDKEIDRIKERISEIEKDREADSGRIKESHAAMKKAEDDYEDAVSTLEDKRKDAEKIAEKHKDTLSGKIYADLELIEGPLSAVLNEKLIDGAVRGEIEKVLDFMTGYDAQVERRNIYYRRGMKADGLGRRTLVVKFPDIAISLWVNDTSGGKILKKHLLSEILVEKLGAIENLQNRSLLTTIFKFSDTSLGEYFAGSYLRKLGLTIDGGIIRLSGLTFEGEKAEIVSTAIEALSWGRYAAFGAAGLPVLFILYLVFSTAGRRRKLAMLKRLLIYPSLLILAACGALLWASRNIFAYYPDIIQDLSLRSYAKHLGFIAAWHFIVPLCIVFGSALVAGLIIRKYLVSTAPE
jgi:hypothetical protein